MSLVGIFPYKSCMAVAVKRIGGIAVGIVGATLLYDVASSQAAPEAGSPAEAETAPQPAESPWPYRI